MQWLIKNAEWVFSGIGVYIIGIGVSIITFIIIYFFKKNKSSISQKQNSGKSSINIQIGGDVRLNEKDK